MATGQAGDNVGLLLRGVKRGDIERGQVGPAGYTSNNGLCLCNDLSHGQYKRHVLGFVTTVHVLWLVIAVPTVMLVGEVFGRNLPGRPSMSFILRIIVYLPQS
jgi:hypothetical protein